MARLVGRVRVMTLRLPALRVVALRGMARVAEVLRLTVSVPLRPLLRAVAAAPAVLGLLRVGPGRGGIAVRRAALGGLLSVRLLPLLLRRRLLRAVVPAASDPESSHVIERTWSHRVTCRARGIGPGFAADL
ncbi:hypothetical protein GCM10010372_21460 [Streptomyces tauricus]|nr:hypothetical protein GCM10010372_21460 [Streptomyces tauricus]